jgi:hypothetical protein
MLNAFNEHYRAGTLQIVAAEYVLDLPHNLQPDRFRARLWRGQTGRTLEGDALSRSLRTLLALKL